MLWALGWEEGVSRRVRNKGGRSRVPTAAYYSAAYYSAREEGTRGAGKLREESLRHPYVPPSCDWCVPH